ncbi:MAG: peptidoglycan DD-metalloendopeptidase family protein [Winogradskyella sp.]|nr:peptidoglycan DD-metalloendopeptidase family protein [Winogradskyella sp.]NNL82623.1 peptidoglycan DD-metalloendopeptidase family protein [Winogradskyella sp.]
MPTFKSVLASRLNYPCTVLDSKFTSKDFVPLDLSTQNTDLQKLDASSSKELHNYIWNYKKLNNAKIAFGGYLEKRKIYQRSAYFNKTASSERNIHLGIDLWLDADSDIFAPINGRVHSFKNNTNFGDYGPTIILEHSIDGFSFFTLYGHLSESSLVGLKEGQWIEKGMPFATLGDASVNGDYPPHLHFQIILDIKDFKGDYPGVCSSLDVDYYQQNCPDPDLILKLK